MKQNVQDHYVTPFRLVEARRCNINQDFTRTTKVLDYWRVSEKYTTKVMIHFFN